MKKLLILFTITVLLTASLLSGYCGFYGIVKKVGTPVAGAMVIFKALPSGDPDTLYTEQDGTYDFECPAGWYYAKASDGPSWIHIKDSVYQTGHVTGTECNFNLINIEE